MNLSEITSKKDIAFYCRNLSRYLDQDDNVEASYLRELAELKYLSLKKLSKKRRKLLNRVRDYLLSDGMLGRIVRHKQFSYLKLFSL
jgi:hypothetical protein